MQSIFETAHPFVPFWPFLFVPAVIVCVCIFLFLSYAFRLLFHFVLFLSLDMYFVLRLFVSLEWTPKSSNAISHVGPTFLRSKDLVFGTLFGQIPIHESTAQFRIAVARNSLVHIDFQWELIIVREFFHGFNVSLGDNHDALEDAVLVRFDDRDAFRIAFFGWHFKGNYLGGTVGIAIVIGVASMATAFGGINDQLGIDAELIILDAFRLICLFSRIGYGWAHIFSYILGNNISLLKRLVGCE